MSTQNLRLQMIFAGTDKATSPMRAVAVGSKAMAGELKKSSDELNRLNQVQGRITGFRTLKGQLTETSRELVAAEKKVGALAKTIATTEAPTRKMTAEFNRAKREASALKDKHGDQQRALQQLRGELNGAGVSTNNLVSDQAKLRTEMARVSTQIDQQKAKLGSLQDQESRTTAGREALDKSQARASSMAVGGAAAVGTGIAIAAPILGAVQGAAEYEQKMTSIGQKTGLSRTETTALAADMRRVSVEANQTKEAIQTGVDVLTGFGMEAKGAVKAMAPIGRAATAYIADIGELGTATYAVIDNLNVPIERTSKMLDIMALGGKKGAFEIRDMAQYFPALTAAASGLGQQGLGAVADLTAALQITRKGAGDSASAANNLLNLMNKINTEDAINKFKKLGIALPAELKKAADAGKSPVEAIVELTNRATGGDLSKLSFLFADAQVQAALRPLIQNFEQFKAIRAEALNANGVVDKDFAVRLKDASEAEKEATIATANLSQEIGSKLLPVYAKVMSLGAGVVRSITSFASANPGLTKAVAVTTLAIGGLLVLAGALAIGIAGVLGPFAMLRYALMMGGPLLGTIQTAFLAVRGAVMAMNLAFLANPVVLIVMAIAAAALLIYTYWDDIGPYFKRLWEGVKSVFSGVFTVFKAILFTFTPAGLIYKHWDTISPYFTKIWGAVKSVFNDHIAAAKDLFLNFTPAGLIYSNWDTISPYFSALWTSVTALWSSNWKIIEDMAAGNYNPYNMIIDRWSSITGFFSGLWARVGGVFSSAWGNIRTMMGGWAASAMQVGSNIVSSIASGIRNAPGAVWAALKGVVFGGIDKIKSLLGFGGAPSPTVATVPKLAGARAAGGPVGAGKAYLVGENGPEIFQPRNHGDIIPNHRIRTLAKAAFVGGGAGLLSASPALAAPRAAPSQSGNSYTIQISVEGGAQGVDEQRIAAAVRREIEAIERERGARNRSAYRDDA